MLSRPPAGRASCFEPAAGSHPRVRSRELSRACRTVAGWHRLRTHWLGALPAEPVIYVCNHLGYIDPLVICSLLPCAPIAKAELQKWPVIGPIAQRLGVIFVRRSDPYSGARALLAARRRLREGISVLNFPEGTTTSGEMIDFRRGIFGIAMREGVPVVPLAMSFESTELCWVGDDKLLSHYGRSVVGRTHEVSVDVGPKMWAAAEETASAFAARTREWIAGARARHARQLPPPAESRAVEPRWVGGERRGAAAASSSSSSVEVQSPRRWG